MIEMFLIFTAVFVVGLSVVQGIGGLLDYGNDYYLKNSGNIKPYGKNAEEEKKDTVSKEIEDAYMETW